MPRGIADVVDAYVERPDVQPSARRLLVGLAPGGFLAARIAVRLLESLRTRLGPLALSACDPGALALMGAARPGRGTLQVLVATQPASLRADAVLWIESAGGAGAGHQSPRWSLPPHVPQALLALGADPIPAGRPGAAVPVLATLGERDALRLALGGGERPLAFAATAVARWLRALEIPGR